MGRRVGFALGPARITVLVYGEEMAFRGIPRRFRAQRRKLPPSYLGRSRRGHLMF